MRVQSYCFLSGNVYIWCILIRCLTFFLHAIICFRHVRMGFSVWRLTFHRTAAILFLLSDKTFSALNLYMYGMRSMD